MGIVWSIGRFKARREKMRATNVWWRKERDGRVSSKVVEHASSQSPVRSPIDWFEFPAEIGSRSRPKLALSDVIPQAVSPNITPHMLLRSNYTSSNTDLLMACWPDC